MEASHADDKQLRMDVISILVSLSEGSLRVRHLNASREAFVCESEASTFLVTCLIT